MKFNFFKERVEEPVVAPVVIEQDPNQESAEELAKLIREFEDLYIIKDKSFSSSDGNMRRDNLLRKIILTMEELPRTYIEEAYKIANLVGDDSRKTFDFLIYGERKKMNAPTNN